MTLACSPSPSRSARTARLNSGDPVGRAVAADVLGQLGFEEGYPYRDRSVPILVERVLDDEVSVIGCAIAALGHLGDAMGLPAVVGAASHAEGVVRFEVAVALPSLLGVGPVDPSTPGVAALISLMCDDDPDVRDWATFGLGTQVATDSAEVRDALADRLAGFIATRTFGARRSSGWRADVIAAPSTQRCTSSPMTMPTDTPCPERSRRRHSLARLRCCQRFAAVTGSRLWTLPFCRVHCVVATLTNAKLSVTCSRSWCATSNASRRGPAS